jgi:hypothetical protein
VNKKNLGIALWYFAFFIFIAGTTWNYVLNEKPWFLLVFVIAILPLHLYNWTRGVHAGASEHFKIIVVDAIFCGPIVCYPVIPVKFYAPMTVLYVCCLLNFTLSLRQRYKKDFKI